MAMNMIRLRYEPNDNTSDYIGITSGWILSQKVTLWSSKPSMSVELLYTYVADHCDLLIEKGQQIVIESSTDMICSQYENTKQLQTAVHKLVKLPGLTWPMTLWPLQVVGSNFKSERLTSST